MCKHISLAIVALLGAALTAAWPLSCSRPPGSNAQEKFFKAVESGDPTQVIALFHPAMMDQVDEPVLAAWMKAVKDNLGAYKSLSGTDFSVDTKYENGATTTESKGTVNFEKGTAQSKVVYRDGQIVEFNVKSDQIPEDWFQGPASTELYRQRGQEFLTALMQSDLKKAFDMMHPALQKEMPLEKLKTGVPGVVAKAGKLKSITCRTDKMNITDAEQTLTVSFDVQGESDSLDGTVEFRFIGLKGNLTAFNLAPKK